MRISNALRMGSSVNTLTLATSVMKGVVPYHYLDFVGNSALEAGVSKGPVSAFTGYTFTRASGGYYENSDGTLTWFDSGVLRRGNRGVLIEGARTNLLLRSQEFDNAAWSKTNVTVTANAIAAPDGTTTADLLAITSTGGAVILVAGGSSPTVTGASCTYSIFVRAGAIIDATSAFTLRDWTAGVNKVNATLTWATMSVSGAGASIQRLGLTDWYRLTLIDTSWTTGNEARVYAGAIGGSYTAGHSWYVWGAQLEAASFPSSYIPTTTASATRAADVLTCTAGVSYPLSLWAEFERAVDTGANEALVALEASSTERCVLRAGNSDIGQIVVLDGGVTVANPTVAGALSVGTTYKLAARVSTDSVQIARGATLGTEDTTAAMPDAPTTLRIGTITGGADPCFGYIRRAAIFNSALSDANLQTVTT